MTRRGKAPRDEMLKSLELYNAVLERLGVPPIVTTAEAGRIPLERLRGIVTATADKVASDIKAFRGMP